MAELEIPVETERISKGSEQVDFDQVEEEKSVGLLFSFAKWFGLKYRRETTGLAGGLMRLYAFLVFTFLSYDVCRTCMMFDFNEGFSDLTLLKLINFSHTINSLASAITLVVFQRSYFQKFIRLWSSTHLGGRIPGHATINFTVRLGLFYVMVVSGFDALVTQLGTYNIWFRLPVVPDFFFGQYEFLAGIATFYITVPVALLHVVFTVVCLVLYFEFDQFNRDIEKQRDDLDAGEQLPYLRSRHFGIIQLTELADFALSYYTLIIFSINVPGLCAVMYVLMTDQVKSTVSTVQLNMWLVIFSLETALVCVVPSMVNLKAHASLSAVEEISNLEGIFDNEGSGETYRHITFFTRQLTSSTIGLTAGGFFSVTNSIILTLVSVMVTYLALIMQLAATNAVNCNCNCTEGIPSSYTFSPLQG